MAETKPFILSIDDDPDFNNLLKVILKKSQLDILTTTTAEEFTKELKKKTPDLCLIDLNLDIAFGAGFPLIQAIRKIKGYDIPIIVISRRGTTEDITRALELGANDFLTKPLDEIILTQKIKYYTDSLEELKDLPLFLISEKDWNCSFNYEVTLYGISEFGITLSSPTFLAKGTPLIIESQLIQEITGIKGPIQFSVQENRMDEESKEYLSFCEFQFEDENVYSRIRGYLLNAQ